MAVAPSSDSGTAAPGISVAWMLRRNSRITSTTSTHDSTSVNSTSLTEARMVWVRSTIVSRWMPGRDERAEVHQRSLDVIDRLDHVGAGLLENQQHDRRLIAMAARRA